MSERKTLAELACQLGIDQDAVDAMRVGWLVAEPHVPDLVDRFHVHPATFDAFALLDAETSARLRLAQEMHLRRLFLSRLDEDYEAQVRRAAIAHKRIGLRLDDYAAAHFAMSEIVSAFMRERFSEAPELLSRILTALPKFVALDVLLTMRVYEAVTLDA